MGFDLYGLNPKGDVPKPVITDWEDEKQSEDYLKYRTETPGSYFRANVWWWRPLWQYVGITCEDILTEDDIASGEVNDNHLISEDKAVLIAKRLQERIDDGSAQAFEDEIVKYMDSVEKDKHGSPKNDDDWMAHYPFTVGNLQEFILFCSESGGFTIG